MRKLFVTFLAVLSFGCASTVHPLDGKPIVLQGRWNSRAKEAGEIVCDTEPKIVNIINLDGHPTPAHNQLVQVRAVLHWRGTTDKQKRSAEQNAIQLPPDGYIIDWSRATWESR